jgi:hypothetical protein
MIKNLSDQVLPAYKYTLKFQEMQQVKRAGRVEGRAVESSNPSTHSEQGLKVEIERGQKGVSARKTNGNEWAKFRRLRAG